MSKLNVPTIIFHSDADTEADPTDVDWLLGQIIHTVVEVYRFSDYGHTDFIWALSAADDIYRPIINYIKRHESTEKLSK